jgi:hypothetical protein
VNKGKKKGRLGAIAGPTIEARRLFWRGVPRKVSYRRGPPGLVLHTPAGLAF